MEVLTFRMVQDSGARSAQPNRERMSSKRKTYSADFKTKVALEALRGERTANQIATCYEVHPSQVTQWKKQALEHLKDAFSSRRANAQKQDEALARRTLQPNRAAQGRARLLEKKSWIAPLMDPSALIRNAK